MITKINRLKSQTTITEVKSLCETAISAISSAIYNNVTSDAQLEIERAALTNLFEELNKFESDKIVKEWLNNQKRVYSVKHLGVRKAVISLLEKEAKYDATLAGILENFRERLEQEIPEVLLYEDFISALSGFNYLPAVNTELNAVGSRVDQYKNDVDISKIIAIMKETRSNYLIPLIEDVIDNYLNNKNEQNKHVLKETLVKFSYDPFITDIINILTLDTTQLQLEYANAECGISDKLFSPILYLGENEVLFNVKGTYYVKKGNNINKIKKDDVFKLDESFRVLCDVINLPVVEVSKKDIKVYVGNDNATLTENEVFINESKFTNDQINEAVEVAKWSGNAEFFNIVGILRENFNEIAELDFIKRVHLKENENYAADIFKLRDNIFITTFDPLNDKITFYRNINPIQAERVMMEHMRFDVSKTFADILPNKERILTEIDETKKEYSDYIFDLEERITKFSDDYNNETSNAVVKALTEELEEIKNDYKDYLNKVETFISVSENLNITVQDDTSGKSYTVVVPTGAMASKGEEKDIGVEGDEFGTEVGATSLPATDAGGAASAVTFDDDQSELISDEPSIEQDKVDLDADEIEAYADKVDAESELEEPEKEPETGLNQPTSGGEELGGSEEGTAELDLGEEPIEPEGGEGEIEEPEKEESEKETEKEEAVGAPNKNLEKTNFKKDANPDDLDEPKKIKKVFLKRPKTKK